MFYDRLKLLCDKNRISAYKACEAVGLNRSAVAKWKKGIMPNGETVVKFAEFFSVESGFFFDDPTKKDPLPETGADQMDEQLQQMLALVEKMTDEERNNIISYMKFLTGSKDGAEEETKK